ncbi:nucleotidyltransferase family protein [Streptococcus suis]|uniref:Nucleotidyltransferase family protein n=2 Tax=Streptococcus suis TaxID=1307 RepID=A0A3R8T761_STRSU|nr:nucleotidyltransferase family protein [Streptococcus suis]RRR51245.1 nucleotidyltransferase family protein [Streptococcus suis]
MNNLKVEDCMKEELGKYLSQDPDINRILEIVKDLDLADSWICAGTIRNFIWNHYRFDKNTDVDLIFYDEKISHQETKEIEANLRQRYPEYQWEVKNQVFMHIHSPDTSPYQSSKDAIEKFPERCTAIGVRQTEKGDIELFAPYGLTDIYNYLVRPTPHFIANSKRMYLYKERIKKKNWKKQWPVITIKYE